MTKDDANRDAARPSIFLGGTCGQNDWRRGFMERLVKRGLARDGFIDPSAARWDEAAFEREERAKASADLLVFVLGDPKEPGVPVSAFALVEAALAVCNDSQRTLIAFDLEGIEGHGRKVLERAESLFRRQDSSVPIFRSLGQAEDWIVERFGVRS